MNNRSLRLRQGRRPVRGRRPAGPRHHRLPLRHATDTGRGIGAKAIKGTTPSARASTRCRVSCYIANYHVLAEVDLDPKAESATVDLQVDPGRTLTIQVVDPEGKPIGGTKASGVGELLLDTRIRSGIAHDRDPRPRSVETPRVTITHAGRKLVGSVYLKGDETGPLTVRLQPWGTITGRIVDDDGKPRGGLGLMERRRLRSRPPSKACCRAATGRSVRIGRDGRFRIEGLVPGLKYGAMRIGRGHDPVGECSRT